MVDLRGRSILSIKDLSVEEIEKILSVAVEMKKNRYAEKHAMIFKYKTFLMFFYNPSLRTRISFEAAATELGGHAQYLVPSSMRLKSKTSAGETIEDAAKVMSRFGSAMGIRILETSVENYGDGAKLIEEYAKYASIPIISMADDKYHPMQGLADVMGMRENIGETKGKTLLQVWGHGALARSYCSVHASMLINSKLGMNIRLAFPKGYELVDEEILETVKKNCQANGTSFEITHNVKEAYEGADIVYSRNWFSPNYYKIIADKGVEAGKKFEIEQSMKYTDWICDEEKMKIAGPNAKFIHPMPIDRGNEVSDEVASGPRSIVNDVAEARLHVQKASIALTTSDYSL